MSLPSRQLRSDPDSPEAAHGVADELADLAPDGGPRRRGRLCRRGTRRQLTHGRRGRRWQLARRRSGLDRTKKVVLDDGREAFEDQVLGTLPGDAGPLAGLPDAGFAGEVGEPG